MKLFGLPVVLWLLATALAPHPAGAEPNTMRNLADQAVLVHRITKSVCLMFVGAETPVHRQDVIASSDTLMSLSAWLAADPNRGAPMTAELATYTKSARQIADGDRHTVPVTLLLLGNQRLSSTYREKWKTASTNVGPQHRAAYALVQDLRVASQSFQRDLCLFFTDLQMDDANAELAAKIAHFSTALVKLVEGDAAAGIAPAPNIHIKITLGKAASKWKTLEPILSRTAAGEPVDPRDAQLASVLGDAILVNLDEISDRFLNL